MNDRARKRPDSWRSLFSVARLIKGRSCTEYLSDYRHDPDLAAGLEFLYTVKHTKQLALNKIMRNRLQKGVPAKVLGGRSTRSYRQGLMVHIASGQPSTVIPMTEPFGMDMHGDKVAIATGCVVRIADLSKKSLTDYAFGWFAQIHSVTFSADGSRILVASTGYDSVIEVDLAQRVVTWFWNSWDNGYSQLLNGGHIERHGNGYRLKTASGAHRIITAKKDSFGLPTGLTATHLNSAKYLDEERFLITLFHQGHAIVVERESKRVSETIAGLLSPHGYENTMNGSKVVTDTRRGRFVFFGADGKAERSVVVDINPIAKSREGLGEWLQNVLPVGETTYAVVDIQRSCIWIIDAQEKRYRPIAIDPSWAAQYVMAIEPETARSVMQLLASGGVSSAEVRDVHGLAPVRADSLPVSTT